MRKACVRYVRMVMLGLFLGLIPIIGHLVPVTVAQFSGMASVASPTGFLICILVIIWLCKENWKKSFLASFLTMATAFLAFYLSVHILFYQNCVIEIYKPARTGS